MTGKLHHMGYAVQDIDAACAAFAELGYYPSSESIYDDLRKVHIAFLKNGTDGAVIELVAPAAAGNPVDGILAKNGAMPYHLCFEVTDLEAAMEKMKGSKYITMGKPMPACAIDNKSVIFMFHKTLGIRELLDV